MEVVFEIVKGGAGVLGQGVKAVVEKIGESRGGVGTGRSLEKANSTSIPQKAVQATAGKVVAVTGKCLGKGVKCAGTGVKSVGSVLGLRKKDRKDPPCDTVAEEKDVDE